MAYVLHAQSCHVMVVLIYELELAIFLEGGGYFQQITVDLFLKCDFFVVGDLERDLNLAVQFQA